MSIRRIVPGINTNSAASSREFYAGFLGLHEAMDMGWIQTYVSSTNPNAQVNVIQAGETPTGLSGISVEVEDVDQAHADAVARGYTIVYPLTDEPWGVRRFWVEDPNGVVVNVMRHLPAPAAPSS